MPEFTRKPEIPEINLIKNFVQYHSMLVDLLEFESIEPGAFYSLIRLRTL